MTWNDLPDHARVWIYPANRALSPAEQDAANKAVQRFATQWTAHRRELSAFGDLYKSRFLRLAVDESSAGASGCSIDASVRFVQQLGAQLGVDWLDRRMVYTRSSDGELTARSVDAFAEAYAEGHIADNTTVVDTLVDSKAKFDVGFERPLVESWHARLV